MNEAGLREGRLRICAVIVNYKTAGLSLDCADSLAGQLDPARDRIIIVDNASGPEECAWLLARLEALGLSGLTRLLPLAVNGGFSAGNNAGMACCAADYYLLANSDTLFRPGAVDGLLEACDLRPEAGLVSPGLEWPDGGAQVSCFRFPRPPSEAIRSADTGVVTRLLRRFDVPLQPRPEPSSPEWTSFACVLIRESACTRVGPLDDGFFMYYEDVDYCARVRAAGFDIVNWPEARVVHLQGRSSDTDERSAARKSLPAFYYRSRARYYRKHCGRAGLLAANLCWLAGRAVSKARELLTGRPRAVPLGEGAAIWTG